ncbi:hypothetical protein [Chryseobacterium caseinilyticum]|uniref:Uncharacterized protein n=1 Tax=Chryseobacterium caseinilyticum TaxID=2771428 RepID=A0ABR8Z7K7_9FLAO|nr:hypothetical protein [Chryseobacterium caseinilyticum]MBD8081104.1 hypothetical protein [Chryseobacterium caseinilyticum]
MKTIKDIAKIKPKILSDKLVPRDWFIAEDEYLTEIGVRTKLGTNWKAPSINELRLYLSELDKKEQREILNDLKTINVYPAIKSNSGTVICIYHDSSANILFYYCRGRKLDCQGLHRKNSLISKNR